MLCSATPGHAPAFQQWHEQDAGRREVEDVLRSTVGRAPHLHDLQRPEEIAATLEVPRHDHAVGEGFLDPPAGIAFLRRTDLRHEERGASLRAQQRPEAEEEVPDSLLVLDSVAHRRDGIEHEPADLLLLDDGRDAAGEETSLLEVHVFFVDAELLVDLRHVDELELSLLRETVVEEVERDDVLQELVGRLGYAQVEAVFAPQGARCARIQGAPWIPPTSMAPGHPNSFRIPTTCFFAAASFPAISISGAPPTNFGSTICVLGTVLKAFTTFAPGSARCTRSARESLSPTNRPGFGPPENSSAFCTSMTTLPTKFFGPARRATSSNADPRVAITIVSPCRAASSNVPVEAFPFAPFSHVARASLFGLREPTFTSCPRLTKPRPSAWPTSLLPKTPTRMGARRTAVPFPPFGARAMNRSRSSRSRYVFKRRAR